MEVNPSVPAGLLDAEEGKLLIGNLEAYTRVLASTALEEMIDKVRSEIRAEMYANGAGPIIQPMQ
jgi:hypothetical protein